MTALQDSGKHEEALLGLHELEVSCQDPVEKVAVMLAGVNSLMALHRHAEARQRLKEGYSLIGKDSGLYPRLALKDASIDMDLGNWEDALAKIDATLAEFAGVLAHPENEDVVEHLRRSRGFALVALRRFREALPLLEEAAARETDKGGVLCHLGTCYYYELGDFERARRCFSDALALGLSVSGTAGAHYWLATIYYKQRKYAWAKQELEACLGQYEKVVFSREDLFTSLKYCSMALGQPDEVKRYSKMLEELSS